MSDKTIGAQSDTAEGFQALKVKADSHQILQKQVAVEAPFTLVANGVELVTLMCTPRDLKALTYGFLFTSGFISGPGDVLSYTWDETKASAIVELIVAPDPGKTDKKVYTVGCGKGVVYFQGSEVPDSLPQGFNFKVNKTKILELARWFQTCSSLHKATSGAHTAAISQSGAIPGSICDDVGRHNAVDKVIGIGLWEKLDFSQCILLSSGRFSSEILHKAHHTGFPVIVSLGAPTHHAILIARTMNITLIGFARGGSFTIFNGEERVEL
jgi:FdhD protein